LRSIDRSCPFGITTLLVVIKLRNLLWYWIQFHYTKDLKKEKIYSLENIKIRFISRQNPQDFGGSKSPAPPLAGLGEQPSSSENSEFVLLNTAPELKLEQTQKENKFPTGRAFEIILPNLIHKSKKRNLS